MEQDDVHIAYIDGANLYHGIKSLGWELDYRRFMVWLSDKYKITTAYIFLGYIPSNESIYTTLRTAGFSLIFKEVVHSGLGPKGNCDAELVLKVTQDFYTKQFTKTVLVSSDGDYACLVNFLMQENALESIVSPSNRCSILLMRTGAPLIYLDLLRNLLELLPLDEKALDGDKTP